MSAKVGERENWDTVTVKDERKIYRKGHVEVVECDQRKAQSAKFSGLMQRQRVVGLHEVRVNARLIFTTSLRSVNTVQY